MHVSRWLEAIGLAGGRLAVATPIFDSKKKKKK
jgi:hypothetical protein